MVVFDQPEKVLHVIEVLSVLGAAGAGLLALFVDYRDRKGRVTKWGRLSIIGIAISAAASLLSDQLQHQIKHTEDIKQQKEAKKANKQFQYQVKQLQSANKQLKIVQTQAKKLANSADITLARIDSSLSKSERLLGSLSLLQKREGERFYSSSQSLWNIENEVHPSSLTLRVSYQCDGDPEQVNKILDGNTESKIFVVQSDKVESYIKATGLKDDGFVKPRPHEDVLGGPVFLSYRRTTEQRGVSGSEYARIDTIDGFGSESGMGIFGILDNWDGAGVHADVDLNSGVTRSELAQAFGQDAIGPKSDLWRVGSAFAIPCTALLEFRIDGSTAVGDWASLYYQPDSPTSGSIKFSTGVMITGASLPHMYVTAK